MKQNPVMTAIIPGRRSLGEDWSKVTITPNADTGEYDVTKEATEAPADRIPIFVPALGNLSIEAADFLLEYKRKDQEYRKANGLSQRNRWTQAEIEQAFYEFLEEKKRLFKRQTHSGPSGWTQRSA